jgi:hypothetical protein
MFQNVRPKTPRRQPQGTSSVAAHDECFPFLLTAAGSEARRKVARGGRE